MSAGIWFPGQADLGAAGGVPEQRGPAALPEGPGDAERAAGAFPGGGGQGVQGAGRNWGEGVVPAAGGFVLFVDDFG